MISDMLSGDGGGYEEGRLSMWMLLLAYGDSGAHVWGQGEGTEVTNRMDDPNLTMEEYIRLEEEKARKRGKVFNWQTATYEKIKVDDDLHDLSSMEAEFPAIVINDTFAPQDTLQCKSQPAISYFDDLDFFNDFKNEFPVIVYNDAQTSKSDLLTELILTPQQIDEFNDKTSLSDYDEEEQNVLYFNDLFPFNMICSDDSKSEKDNDNNKIDIIQSFEKYKSIHGSNALFETSHDKKTKDFITESFVIKLNENIVIWIFYANGTLFFLIMNLCALFGVPFDPKRYEGLEYTDSDIVDFESRLERIYSREVHRVLVVDFLGMPDLLRDGLIVRWETSVMRPFTFGLGSYAYWIRQSFYISAGGARTFRDATLRDYWRGISSAGDFLSTTTSYTLIRDPILRLCHRLIACSIAGRSQAPEKVTVTDLFYLRGIDVGSVNVPYLLVRYLRLFAAGRKSGAHIYGGQFVARLAGHFGILTTEILGGLTVITLELQAWVAMGPERQPDAVAGAPAKVEDAPIVDEGSQADPTPAQAPQQPPPPPPALARTMVQRLGRLEEDVQGLRQDVGSLRGLVERSMTDQGRFSTWTMTQLMEASGLTYQAFDGFFRGSSTAAFQRRTRQRTGEANTSTAQPSIA
ncbi:hypothetical protein Tco_0839365 [Tanacetum coccineum]|uniref:Uncharacterized protein n=1 Tax=Tanacetum coccineum TaxID=301880 RepID=A0ABQ5AUE8_9ASTR